MKNFNMKLPVESGGGAAGCIKPEATEAPAVPRKRPRSAANGQGGVGPLRPPSRAMAMAPTALSWGSHLHQCAPQIAIPDARLHLAASNRPRSRYNSVRNNYFPTINTLFRPNYNDNRSEKFKIINKDDKKLDFKTFNLIFCCWNSS